MRLWTKPPRAGPSRLNKSGLLALAGVALALAATGAGIAGTFLAKSPAQEEQGLLDGHSVFHPTCTRRAENEYRCVLARPPTGEGTIDGGCIGASDDGRVWDCTSASSPWSAASSFPSFWASISLGRPGHG